jgi:hypothetical protein
MRKSKLNRARNSNGVLGSVFKEPPRAKAVNHEYQQMSKLSEDYESQLPTQRELELRALQKSQNRAERIRRDRERKMRLRNEAMNKPNPSRKRKEDDSWKLENQTTETFETLDGESVELVSEAPRRRRESAPSTAQSIGRNPSPRDLIPKD